MARLERFQLEYVRSNAFGNKGIHQLIKEKNDKLDDLKNQRPTSYNKHTPKLTPSNDITVDKTFKSKGLDDKTYDKRFDDVKNNYNDKVFQSTKEHFEKNNPLEDMDLLEELGKDDLALLLEKDSDAVLDKWEAQKLEREQKVQNHKENGLDITLDNRANDIDDIYDRTEYFDFDEESLDNNKEDIDKSPDPSDDFE